MNCHRQKQQVISFPLWPFMPFAVPLILENITPRIIFWHSNVIASTRTGVPLLPRSFSHLACLTHGRRETLSGWVFVVVFIVTPRPCWPNCAASWTDHQCINNSVSCSESQGVGTLKILWLVIMCPHHHRNSPSSGLCLPLRQDTETSLKSSIFPSRLRRCPSASHKLFTAPNATGAPRGDNVPHMT